MSMNKLDFSVADESVESAAGSLNHYRNWRRRNPEAKFKTFLKEFYNDQTQLDDELLIELATTDLIHMLSNGHRVQAESYIRSSKSLASRKELVLDLIDAEICTRSDRGETINSKELAKRFPKLKSDLKRLIEVHEIDLEASNELRLQKQEENNFGNYLAGMKIADSDAGFEVWTAKHCDSEQPFSIIKWEGGDQHTQTDIQRKLELRKRTQHPCLLNIVEVGFSDYIYYVTDPIAGETLVDRLDNPTLEPIGETTVAKWVAQILAARQELVKNLDRRFLISLDQIFVTSDQEVLLLNGPSLFDAYSDEPSFETVLQSVGLLLFATCLQETDITKVRSHLNEGFDPIMINDVNENISAELNSIYLSCVHSKPKHRYRSVDEVILDLDNFQSDKPLKATKIQRKWF